MKNWDILLFLLENIWTNIL